MFIFHKVIFGGTVVLVRNENGTQTLRKYLPRDIFSETEIAVFFIIK